MEEHEWVLGVLEGETGVLEGAFRLAERKEGGLAAGTSCRVRVGELDGCLVYSIQSLLKMLVCRDKALHGLVWVLMLMEKEWTSECREWRSTRLKYRWSRS